MIVGRGNHLQILAARGASAALSRALVCVCATCVPLLVGCADSSSSEQLLEQQAETSVVPNDKVAAAILRVLAADKAQRALNEAEPKLPADAPIAEQLTTEQVGQTLNSGLVEQPPADEKPLPEQAVEQVAEETGQSESEGLVGSEYFSWTTVYSAADAAEPQADADEQADANLIARQASDQNLSEPADEAEPAVGEIAEVEEVLPAMPPEYVTTPFAVLLPSELMAAASDVKSVPLEVPSDSQSSLSGLSESERQIVERVFRETSPTATGVLTDARVNEMATTSIRAANALANRGAQFAARQKLVEAMRMISQAKDASQGDPSHSAALAAGLRALEEAEDFAPRGTQLEGEMDVAVIVAAHRTPIAKQLKTTRVPPRLMMDLYFRYAQVKLAEAVSGEPAGSMALYALGKVTSQIGHTAADHCRLSHRQAVAYQQAALLAHNQNYFAAHELGVLLAESGRLGEAERLLRQVASRQPNPTVYRNLASVEQRMGKTQLAAHNRALATQLAAQQPMSSRNVNWVGPDSFGASPITPTQYAGPVQVGPRYPNERSAMAPPPRAPQPNGPVPPGSWR